MSGSEIGVCNPLTKPVITIPTYNERENISQLVDTILTLRNQYRIIVIDDNSPDGTFRIVDRMSKTEPRLTLIHRMKDKGRGTAGIVGFQKALEIGADAVIEMDADFSHNPADIPRLLETLNQADLVIGSRMVEGGSESGRAAARQYITRLASIFIRVYLRLPLLDPTSGFRAFRAEVLQRIPLSHLQSRGPSIVEEILYYTHRLGFRIKEIPIQFHERHAGTATFNSKILLQTLWFILRLPFNTLISSS